MLGRIIIYCECDCEIYISFDRHLNCFEVIHSYSNEVEYYRTAKNLIMELKEQYITDVDMVKDIYCLCQLLKDAGKEGNRCMK